MYSWEITPFLEACDFSFSEFYGFQQLINHSPQLHYSLKWEDEKRKCIHLFSDDGNEWEVFIDKKEKY